MTEGSKQTRGDAFKQKKGDLYQFITAVQICLEAKEGERIQIEGKGDISSDNLYSYEIKQYESNFTFQTDQFWNTLYNWIFDINIYKCFSKLILLTTSDTEDKDLVTEWNSSTKEEKFERLKKLKPKIENRSNVSENKLTFLKKIFSFNKDYTKEDLLIILDKTHVVLNATPAKEKTNEIMNLDCFKFDSEVVKRRLIDAATSFILDTGLSKTEWVIETSELHNTLKKLKEDKKYKLKRVDNLDGYQHEDYKAYKFVKEIQKINLEGEIVDLAIQDYYIASEQIKDIIDEFPGLKVYLESLGSFSKELLRNLKNIKAKNKHANHSDNEIYNYHDSFEIGLKIIELIENNEDFQRGNIHKIVQVGDHKWKMNENK